MNEQHNEADALDIRAYLRPIWRRKWIILAIVVIATGATYYISSRQQKQYVATTVLYVQIEDPTQGVGAVGLQASPSSQSLADVAQLALDRNATNAVGRQLGMPVSSAGSVTASPVLNTSFVDITATSPHPVLAARLANAYASQFLRGRQRAVAATALRQEQAAQVALSRLPANATDANTIAQRNAVLGQIITYRQAALSPSAGASQIDPAAAPSVPSSPRPKRDAIFGGVVGLVLGLIAAFCLELLDRRLTRVAVIESVFGGPVLATLPHVGDPTPLVENNQPVVPAQFVEELRSLTVFLRLAGDGPARVIMITSTQPREGKSTITRDLALVYAGTGHRVLIIDGDLRRPSMERLFHLEAEKGLVHILRGEASLSDATVRAFGTQPAADRSPNGRAPTTVGAPWSPHRGGSASRGSERIWPSAPDQGVDPGSPGSVDVVTHGERLENPLALMSADRMGELFAEASAIYDIVLLDTPPVLTVADSVPLMEVVDSVLLVARLGQTTRHAADRFTELVARLKNITFSGVIANDQREKLDDEGYGSYGRYGYGYSSDGKRTRDRDEDNSTAGTNGAVPSPPAPVPPSGKHEVASDLEELGELHANGALTDAEFVDRLLGRG